MVYENLNIIIPCKNEADNLHYIIPKLLTYCNDITVVDGNSEDNTKDVCAKYNVKYIKDNNLGKGAAQRIGANASKKKYIIFFDGDCSHDDKDIPLLYSNISGQKFDMVICSRKTGGSEDLISTTTYAGFIRATGSDLLALLLNKLFKTKISDVLYSLKAFKTEKFLELNTKENHFGIEIDIILRGIHKNFNYIEIPSREKKRIYGVSKLNTIAGLYFIWQIIKFKFITKL